ncbi:HNH endonuclease signature motif containing protein [Mycobacterium sp. SMC-4]|uniref:HNH endonuclease signature motif containing protein n=1 Tax=Mycobacterium sp. SMC-4 TaxID=2857059 RepID=UPI0021B37412|nr:HNH endonuclease signature motif containing protein [Mycobacterium sp. SMC-4]UXA20487.1 HNH endonuclease [Mycobacterium sp. SMC-4]
MYVLRMVKDAVADAVSALRAAFESVAACDINLLDRAELVNALDELETLTCQLPSVSHRLLAQLQTETTPQAMGAKNWKEFLAVRWRISVSEANRRLTEADLLAPRHSLTGPQLPPALHATAVAQRQGLINAEHVEVIRKALNRLPGFVDATTRDQFEVDLVRTAVGNGPKELKDAADLTLFLLDQDGPEPDDAERDRKRGLTMGKQGADGMTRLVADMTPEARAVWEPLLARFAAPGMCNPADPQPCTAGTPTQAQIDNDHRSLAQRQHDAIVAVGRIALMTKEPGQLNGLPVMVIIRTTLQDLESRAGVGVSGGGTVIPIADVVRRGAHAHHALAVFDKATGSALELFRTKRIASPAQRIMLISRDGGCTKPGCTVGAYGSQVHHAVNDWMDGGNTNVDEMCLACGPDNRSVDRAGGWVTRMNERHEVEWIPPPGLDTGQARINNYHHPERLLRPPDEPEVHGGNDTGQPTKAGDGDLIDDAPTGAARRVDEPGGPAPPDDHAA